MAMRRAGEAVVRRADDAVARVVAAGTATDMQVLLGEEDGAPHFAMRRFRMGPGGGMPLHTNAVEHEQFVLRGRARVTVAGDAQEVREGSVLLIPAGVPHSYEVIEAPFEFLCLVPNLEDEIRLVSQA
jgi:quercetin dioxygenase-like cupin family protein